MDDLKETNYSKDDLDQLNELIALAEKSSDKKDELRDKIFKLLVYISLSAVVFILLMVFLIYGTEHNLFENTERVEIMTVEIFPILVSIKSAIDYKNYRSELKKEIKTLSALLNMVDELKQFVFNKGNIKIVQKALIEMRLSRISFYTNDKYVPVN